MRKMLTLIIAAMLCVAPVAHADDIEVHDPVVLPVSSEDIRRRCLLAEFPGLALVDGQGCCAPDRAVARS